MRETLYDERYYLLRGTSRAFKVEAEILYELLGAEPDSRILEVGCGAGAFLAYLEEMGHAPSGVDILQSAVQMASGKLDRSKLECCDASSLPFPDGFFDRLVSHHLIEHLRDVPGALAEWSRVLSRGGIMVLCTPNVRYRDHRIFDDPDHVRIYSRQELCGLVRDAGLEVVDSLTVFPHLLLNRLSIWVGVRAWSLFSRVPYFRDRGRSLFISARKG